MSTEKYHLTLITLTSLIILGLYTTLGQSPQNQS